MHRRLWGLKKIENGKCTIPKFPIRNLKFKIRGQQTVKPVSSDLKL